MENFVKELELYIEYTGALWSLQAYWILTGVHLGIGLAVGLPLLLKARKASRLLTGVLVLIACCCSSVISPLLLFVVAPISFFAIKENNSTLSALKPFGSQAS